MNLEETLALHIKSIVLCWCDVWELGKTDKRTVEAFGMWCRDCYNKNGTNAEDEVYGEPKRQEETGCGLLAETCRIWWWRMQWWGRQRWRTTSIRSDDCGWVTRSTILIHWNRLTAPEPYLQPSECKTAYCMTIDDLHTDCMYDGLRSKVSDNVTSDNQMTTGWNVFL